MQGSNRENIKLSIIIPYYNNNGRTESLVNKGENL